MFTVFVMNLDLKVSTWCCEVFLPWDVSGNWTVSGMSNTVCFTFVSHIPNTVGLFVSHVSDPEIQFVSFMSNTKILFISHMSKKQNRHLSHRCQIYLSRDVKYWSTICFRDVKFWGTICLSDETWWDSTCVGYSKSKIVHTLKISHMRQVLFFSGASRYEA